MHGQSSGPQDRSERRLQRAVVLELLGVESDDGLATAQLARALGIDIGELDRALGELGAAGVLEQSQGTVRATSATWRLNDLELIAI